MGDLACETKDYDKGFEYYEKALDILYHFYSRNAKSKVMADILFNMAVSYNEKCTSVPPDQKDTQLCNKTIKLYKAALQSYQNVYQSNNHQDILNVFTNLGKLYIYNGDYKESLWCFQQIKTILTPNDYLIIMENEQNILIAKKLLNISKKK